MGNGNGVDWEERGFWGRGGELECMREGGRWMDGLTFDLWDLVELVLEGVRFRKREVKYSISYGDKEVSPGRDLGST